MRVDASRFDVKVLEKSRRGSRMSMITHGKRWLKYDPPPKRNGVAKYSMVKIEANMSRGFRTAVIRISRHSFLQLSFND